MRWWRGFASGLVIGLIAGAVFLSGYLLGSRQKDSPGADTGFTLLWQIRDLLARGYIDEGPSTQTQVHGAARGLVASYGDPYTVFVDPAPRQIERDELAGHFGGIGAYMNRNEAGEVVLTVIRDRPAARAGVRDGDVLVRVDGRIITSEMKVEEVVAMVRGEVGISVNLELQRPDVADAFTITVVRERIDTPSVEWRLLDPVQHVGYIRISIFGERTSAELQAAIAELAEQGVKKAVLDLRGNGGGLVDAAVDITSQFLREGRVLWELKRGGQERFYPVKPSTSAARDWEIAILTDGGTASASEIVAGALRDQGRAVLVGEKTFGKGSVQEVHEFGDGSSLHVTVARWLTPDRHQIDKAGLDPDVQVGLTNEDREAGRDPQLDRGLAWLRGDR